MGYIQSKINTKLPKAFDGKLSDAVTSFTGSREVAGSYDPSTGTTSTTTETYEGRGVFGSFRAEELTQHIEATDEKLVCLQSELLMRDEQGTVTATAAEPQVDDTINGQTVVSVMQDPAKATWTLSLRRT